MTSPTAPVEILAAGTKLAEPIAGTPRLILAALLGIAVIVVLVLWAKLNPFISLVIGSLTVSIVAGAQLKTSLDSFASGVGSTVAGVGLLIALGAAFGKVLVDSGGADRVVDTIISRSSQAALPWAMAGIGAIIGLPMFFEIGLILLMPVIMLVARRSGLGLIRIGIPALAGLSAMHGLVPPHPGPLIGIDTLKADLGITMGLGILVAIPTIIVAGPLFAKLAAKWVVLPLPTMFDTEEDRSTGAGAGAGAGNGAVGSKAGAAADTQRPGPSFTVTIIAILIPVVLMLGKALVAIFMSSAEAKATLVYRLVDFVGTPLVALLITLIASFFLLGTPAGMDRKALAKSVSDSLPPIAGIILIVGAGGGFKQALVDTGIGTVIADFVVGSSVSPILIAWFVAVLIRLATGSATVATITASAIMLPIVQSLGIEGVLLSLIVLSIGAGSVFFSHINDAGFWLIKEYFGMSVTETVRSWSIMETILSVTGLLICLAIGVFI